MRTTLIMFAVLLVVLTLLSTFGGAIAPKKELFFAEDEKPLKSIPSVAMPSMVAGAPEMPEVPEMPEMPSMAATAPPVPKAFQSHSLKMMT